MSDAVTIAIIAALASTVASIAAMVVGIINGRRVQTYQREVNSRLSELLIAEKQESYRAGKEAGIEHARKRLTQD